MKLEPDNHAVLLQDAQEHRSPQHRQIADLDDPDTPCTWRKRLGEFFFVLYPEADPVPVVRLLYLL